MLSTKALLLGLGALGAAAIGIHLFAPELMHQLGHMLHGGR